MLLRIIHLRAPKTRMTCCARFPIPVYKINRRHRSFTQWNCPCPCQITATDCQIYQPLYQLYGLTDEEGSS